MAKLSELSKGDRVVIARTSRYYNIGRSNPDDSVKGTVEVISSIFASVRWDNGETNGYKDHDLEFISSRDTDFKVMPKTFNFKEGDKIRIIANTNGHGFAIGAIGIIKGTKKTASKGGYYWNVDGVIKRGNAVRECDMELITGSISSTASDFDVDSDDDEESEYDDDEDEDDPDDGVSWFDSSEEEALDKLDKMSKGEAKEVWFEESPKSFWDDYTPPTKRPKLEVEIIPHKSRTIF